MFFEWSEDQYSRLPPIVGAARELLEDWFLAMESGLVESRMPDPLYPVAIDEAITDQIVAHLDSEFERELRAWASKQVAGGYTAGPGFARLERPQRLALAQQLHALKVLHQDAATQTAHAA